MKYRQSRHMKNVPTMGKETSRQRLLFAMEIQIGIIGKALHDFARGKQTARANMKTAHSLVALEWVCLKNNNGVFWCELSAGSDHMGQHLGGGGFTHRLAVLKLERIGVGRKHEPVPHSLQGPSLRYQALVSVGVKVHVRIDLEVPVFACIQRHGQRARPARASRLQGVDVD